MARALCFWSCIPISFWGECALTSVFSLIDLLLILHWKISYELLHGKMADYPSFLWMCVFLRRFKLDIPNFIHGPFLRFLLDIVPVLRDINVWCWQNKAFYISMLYSIRFVFLFVLLFQITSMPTSIGYSILTSCGYFWFYKFSRLCYNTSC